MAEQVNHHPLMFTFKDSISGDGFLTGITLSGRALMLKEEDGKWWMYGVRPGSMAENGNTPQETFLRFRNRYKEILFDIAEDHRTFPEFKEEVERFSNESDEEEERRWADALTAIRAGRCTIPPPFSDLPRQEPEDRPTHIEVERLDVKNRRFMPSDNVPDSYMSPVAA